MTQENKELLIKDLCARLPYGVEVEYNSIKCEVLSIDKYNEELTIRVCPGYSPIVKLENIKPFLFPLSSMTIEQEKELSKLGVSYGEYARHDDIRGLGIMVDEAYIFFEFCYKHHIDFLGLIEKDLAIDATGLNIY